MSSFNIRTNSESSVSNNNTEWRLDSDVSPCCQHMSPTMDTISADVSPVQTGLDGHLPPLHADIHSDHGGLVLDLSSPGDGFLESDSLEYCSSDGNNASPLFERRKRSRSNSSRPRFNDVVTELAPEEVRWFYREDKKTWKSFVGHDSLNIELAYRKYCELNPRRAAKPQEECATNGVESGGLNGTLPEETAMNSENEGPGSLDTSTVSSDERESDSTEVNVDPVCVRGGLYEVHIRERECLPVYWKRELELFFPCISYCMYPPASLFICTYATSMRTITQSCSCSLYHINYITFWHTNHIFDIFISTCKIIILD